MLKQGVRNAYVITCEEVIEDEQGQVIELRCTYDPATLGGKKPAHGRKVKGIIHWLPVHTACDATVRLYDRLFNVENPAALEDFTQAVNPDSLKVIAGAKVEPALAQAQVGERFQFTRLGYFCADAKEHTEDHPVFNRVVGLRDAWK